MWNACCRSVETAFAVDSSGFATSRYMKWFDEKYGINRERAERVECHLACGVKTNVVTAAVADEKNSGDCPQFAPLIKKMAENSTVEEVPADKACATGVMAFLLGTPVRGPLVDTHQML